MIQFSETKPARYFLLFIGVISISTSAIFIRFAQQEADSLVIAAARMTLSVIPLFLIVTFSHIPELKKISKKNLLLSLLSGVLLAMHFATWITSLELTSIASSVVLVCTTPIWVTMFSAIFYKEKVNKLVILGILFATIGGILVALSAHCTLSFIKPACDIFADGQSSTNSVGNLLAFLGALFAAGYLILGKTVRKSVPLVPYAFIVYLTSAVILTVLVILYNRPVIFYKPNTYIYFVLVAVFPQLIGHSILNWALKYLSTTYVSIAQMGEPVGSTILAIFIFREIPTTLKIIGAIFILAGIFVASRPTTKN